MTLKDDVGERLVDNISFDLLNESHRTTGCSKMTRVRGKRFMDRRWGRRGRRASVVMLVARPELGFDVLGV